MAAPVRPPAAPPEPVIRSVRPAARPASSARTAGLPTCAGRPACRASLFTRPAIPCGTPAGQDWCVCRSSSPKSAARTATASAGSDSDCGEGSRCVGDVPDETGKPIYKTCSPRGNNCNPTGSNPRCPDNAQQADRQFPGLRLLHRLSRLSGRDRVRVRRHHSRRGSPANATYECVPGNECIPIGTRRPLPAALHAAAFAVAARGLPDRPDLHPVPRDPASGLLPLAVVDDADDRSGVEQQVQQEQPVRQHRIGRALGVALAG